MPLIFNLADERVVPDTIAPKTSEVAVEDLTKLTRIGAAGDTGFHELDDAAADRSVQPIELTDRILLELNRPARAPALPPPGSTAARASRASRPREDSRRDPP